MMGSFLEVSWSRFSLYQKHLSCPAVTLRGALTNRIYQVIMMDSLPQVAVGMRTSLSLAIVVVIVTEMFIGTTWGIGHRIFDAQLTYRVPEMYSAIIIAGLLGYGLNKGFIAAEERLVHWSGK